MTVFCVLHERVLYCNIVTKACRSVAAGQHDSLKLTQMMKRFFESEMLKGKVRINSRLLYVLHFSAVIQTKTLIYALLAPLKLQLSKPLRFPRLTAEVAYLCCWFFPPVAWAPDGFTGPASLRLENTGNDSIILAFRPTVLLVSSAHTPYKLIAISYFP